MKDALPRPPPPLLPTLTSRACLQYTPLVGVPSFVELSQERDLHCFFVLVRSSETMAVEREREDPADSAFDEALAPVSLDEISPAGSIASVTEGVILPRPMWPVMAFAAAIEDEPCEPSPSLWLYTSSGHRVRMSLGILRVL